jgi:hypothetical protein
MNKKYYAFLFLNFCYVFSHGQVKQNQAGILAQEYSKELTEYRVKSFITNELIQLKENEVINLEVNSITASKSGEITTVVYKCKELENKGLIFAFYGSFVNEFSLQYTGYHFKNLDKEKAKQLFDKIDNLIIINDDFFNPGAETIISPDLNIVFKFDDMTFIFFKGNLGANLLRVIWKNFDSEWNLNNLKTTQKRFNKFFD